MGSLGKEIGMNLLVKFALILSVFYCLSDARIYSVPRRCWNSISTEDRIDGTKLINCINTKNEDHSLINYAEIDSSELMWESDEIQSSGKASDLPRFRKVSILQINFRM